MDAAPFWKLKTLAEMTAEEWESLCDRCGKCCVLKIEDMDDGTVHYTDIACKLLDTLLPLAATSVMRPVHLMIQVNMAH